MCKTNPIRPVGRGPGEQNAQNEPNCPKRGTEAVSGLGIEDESTPGRPRVARGGRNVRNKANFPVAPGGTGPEGRGPGGLPSPSPLRPLTSADPPHKQTQFAGGGNGRGPGRPGTEPPARRINSAKQSQFAPGGAGRPSPRPEALTLPPVREGGRAKQSQFPAAWGGPRGECRQDHRHRRVEVCETKPIPPTWFWKTSAL